jgi:AcrR family transcriptional regulator
MRAPRGDSRVTRKRILAAARDLFARRGVDSVSVREIAAEAGVNHARVHRYFGAKTDIVAEILEGEARAMSAMARPGADTVTSMAALREVFSYVLTGGRTSLLLMLRAEIDGLAPALLLDGAPLRPFDPLARWLERRGPGAGEIDPRVVAMVLGAALMGPASVQPMLAAGVGLEGEDQEAVLQRCVDALVGVAAGAIGAGHPCETPAGGRGPEAPRRGSRLRGLGPRLRRGPDV